MPLAELRYGSISSYLPRGKWPTSGSTPEMKSAQNWVLGIKNNSKLSLSDGTQCLASEIAAQQARIAFDAGDLEGILGPDFALVPVPRSGLLSKGDIWPGREIAIALQHQGLGHVVEALVRSSPLPKSSHQKTAARSSVEDHVASLEVQGLLLAPFKHIVLVDDVVTRGTQLMGAAKVIAGAQPEATITGFAAIEACYQESNFTGIAKRMNSTIILHDSGKVYRNT